ncbi:MAG TPA: sialidase family protein [Steroidobacteraceae bacterium]|nr:sialidase family protein [Steroidobacteraceae bacterium]
MTPFSQGSNPQVGPVGQLYIAYESAVCESLACNNAGDHDAIIVATSFDGGRTFINTEVTADFDFPFNDDVEDSTLTGENFRLNSFPMMTIDPVTGKLYIVWADDRNGDYNSSGESVRTNGDVFIVGSFDGFHWSQPKPIGSHEDEFFPAVAAFGGQVAVTFYTRHYDPKGIGLDVAAVTAFDALGLNVLSHVPLRRITTETENPQVQFVGIGALSGIVLQGTFIGDYAAVAMGSDGLFHPCWTDFRGKPGVTAPNQDIYTQAIRFAD